MFIEYCKVNSCGNCIYFMVIFKKIIVCTVNFIFISMCIIHSRWLNDDRETVYSLIIMLNSPIAVEPNKDDLNIWGISIQHSSLFRNRTMLLDIFVKAFTNRWKPQSFRYSHIYKQNYIASSGFIAKKMCAKYFCVVSHCFKLSRGLTASSKAQLMFKTETMNFVVFWLELSLAFTLVVLQPYFVTFVLWIPRQRYKRLL